MTAKERVRKAYPNAFATYEERPGPQAWKILVEVATLKFSVKGSGRRESWAWAEAARNLNL